MVALRLTVQKKIHYCGICASDLHTMTSGWGPAAFVFQESIENEASDKLADTH